ncbi:Lrp/AsnC ligand binding domain-containing protein [Streptomyces hirsutus]|uniref:Lrp/AsnC ligand binding domain-containing protein n=1 Tax=Streptomyces hirsutus TaxID=35620 RepID=UPI0036470AA1
MLRGGKFATALGAYAGDGQTVVAALPLRRPTGPSVTGRTNLVVSALCRSTEELYTFLSEGIGALPGVHTAETVLTLRRVKTLTAEHR